MKIPRYTPCKIPRSKKYQIIYADPPWRYKDKLKLQNEGSANHYDTLSIEKLKEIDIQSIADNNCALFLWTTMPMIPNALEVINSWGFTYRTNVFTWIKQNRKGKGVFFGLGRWTRGNAELCLLAIKGKPKRINAGVPSVIMSPLRKHSQKPDEVRDRIVDLIGDLPRVELFAKEKTPGWDCIGYEIDGLDINESIKNLTL